VEHSAHLFIRLVLLLVSHISNVGCFVEYEFYWTQKIQCLNFSSTQVMRVLYFIQSFIHSMTGLSC
jgi:hypothetical protein